MGSTKWTPKVCFVTYFAFIALLIIMSVAVFEEELVHEVQEEEIQEEEVILDDGTFLSENIFCESVVQEPEEVFINEVTLEEDVNEVTIEENVNEVTVIDDN